ncbi:MAG: hypothetical protein F6K26_27155 [Moorea sp. SIO2I5]|nr:hypothetical protein [Moorena sp. SIO2I5]
MQRGLGKAARSWGGSAVLGVSPMSDCRGSHGANSGADAGSAHRPMRHERLPWFPPLALCIKTGILFTTQREMLYFTKSLQSLEILSV